MKLIAFHLILVFVAASGLSWLEHSGRAHAARPGVRTTDRPTFVVQGSRIQAVPVESERKLGAFATWSPATDRPTLLLVFAEGCPNCDRVVSSWRELLGLVRPSDTEPLPIDVGLLAICPAADARRYVEEHGLEGELLVADLTAAADDRGFELLVPFDSVPQTVLLEPGGRVVRSRVGGFEVDSAREWIEAIAQTVVHHAPTGDTRHVHLDPSQE